MKRILFFIVMTLCAMTTFAQETKEQIQKSEERAKNLQTLLDKYSDTTTTGIGSGRSFGLDFHLFKATFGKTSCCWQSPRIVQSQS